MRARVPRVAWLLRVVGLAGTIVGCVMAVASLSKTWTVDGPRAGHAAAQSGWQGMAYGDWLLTGTCVLVGILATALCVGPRSRKTSRTAGGAALVLLLAALAGVGLAYWMMGLDLSVDLSLGDTGDEPNKYAAGPGFGAAATALGAAVLGMLVLLAGRWEARTRKALRREAAAAAVPEPEGEPSWAR